MAMQRFSKLVIEAARETVEQYDLIGTAEYERRLADWGQTVLARYGHPGVLAFEHEMEWYIRLWVRRPPLHAIPNN